MTFEQKRKLFHFSSIIFPVLYYLSSKEVTVTILIIANLIILTLDINRHFIKKIQEATDKFLKWLMRPHEYSGTKQLSGVSYMFLGFLLTAIFFNKDKVILSWFVLIISDSIASLYGQKYGTKTPTGKSLEGSFAFFISGFFVCLVCQVFMGLQGSFTRIVFAIFITSVAEFYSKKLKIDDNLLIPLTFCCFA
jgi:dolichol kinase